MATITLKVDLPERSNPFFNAMTDLLPKQIFNIDPDFMIPRLEPVPIQGTVVPFSVVKIFINGADRSPVPDIVADSTGAWTSTVVLTPGQNTIQVQFFPPEITTNIVNAFSPTLTVGNTLVHPSLFSAFSTDNTIQQIALDGTFLYIGDYIPPPNTSKTLYRYDLTTGASIILDESTGSPLSGRVYYMALDSAYLYVSQTMGDASIKLSRYAKDLSARADITTFTAVPSSLYSDGTNLWAVRNQSSVKMTKITPNPFAIVGSDLDMMAGLSLATAVTNTVIADDGTNLMVPIATNSFGEGIGSAIYDGVPGLGGNSINVYSMVHGKVLKSSNTLVSQPYTNGNFNLPTESYSSKNGLVYTGGYYYAVAPASNGKIIKMQDTIINTFASLSPVDCIPLPFSTVGCDTSIIPIIKLGPDGRIYVTSGGHVARWMPGASSMVTLPRGAQSLDVTLNDIAIVDDTIPTRVIDAPTTIFTDRATTFNIPAPAVPTIVGCNYDATHGAGGVAWNPQSDGSAFIVEASTNGGAFLEIGREYFGHGFYHQNPGIFNSGETLTYRIKAFNSTGTSAASSTATVTLPFVSPPYAAPSGLAVGTITTNSVALSWTNNEVTFSHHIIVYKSTDNVHFTAVNSLVQGTTSYTVPSLPSDTLYYFYVTAETPGGIGHIASSSSNTVSATTLAPVPPMPIGVSAVSGWDGVVVSWVPGIGIGDGPTDSVKFASDMWIANTGSNSVSKVVTVGTQTAYPITGAGPVGISSDGSNLWTCNSDNSVTKVTPLGASTNYPSPGTGIDTSNRPQSAAFSSVTGDIWFANFLGASVTRFSPSTGAVAVFSLNGGTQPWSIAFDGTNMWTANANSTVTKITPAGVATTYSGLPGTGAIGIAFDGTNMWVTTPTFSGDSHVTKVNPAGAMTSYLLTGAQYSFGIAYDNAGSMWIANQQSNNVTKINTTTGSFVNYAVGVSLTNLAFDGTNMWGTSQSGSLVYVIPPSGTGVTSHSTVAGQTFSIVFDGTNMWITTGNVGITKINATTFAATNFGGTGGSGYAINMAYDGANIWLGDQGGSAYKWSAAGVRTNTSLTGTGSMVSPTKIAYDGTNMWTVNTGNNTVTKVSSTGVMTTYPLGPFTSPTDIAYDNAGNMWTTNSGNNTVSKIAISSGAVTSFAVTGGTTPYGIAFDGTNMWTANYGNNSVSKITPLGAVTTFTGTGANPIDIYYDGTNMWTANYTANSVTKVTALGAMTTYPGTGASPISIVFDGVNMWTTNRSENSVTKINPSGVMATYPTGYGAGPITGYSIERSIDNGSSFPTTFTVGAVTSYTDATASAQAQVMYRVHATGPGGNSTTSPNTVDIAPVTTDIQITNIDSSNGPLLIDNTFAYMISGDSGGVKVVITTINVNTFAQNQNLAVYTPTGTFAFTYSAIMFGGFIYILIKDQGESNGKIIKVDPSTLTVVGSLALTTGAIYPSGSGMLFTDGTDCWAISGLFGASLVTHFDPVTMSAITVGPTLGSNIRFTCGMAFGGNIYGGYFNQNTNTSFVARISASTLAIVEAVQTPTGGGVTYLANDGTAIYGKVSDAGNSNKSRIEKYTTGPLAFSAASADLGGNNYGNLIYDAGSNALYMQQQNNSLTGGFQKVSTAPAFVSFITDTHFTSGTVDGCRTDGTHIYFSNNNGYIARKLISSF